MAGRTALVCDLAEVRPLNLGGDADERAPQRVLGRREQHLLLHLRVVGRPDRRGSHARVFTMAVTFTIALALAFTSRGQVGVHDGVYVAVG